MAARSVSFAATTEDTSSLKQTPQPAASAGAKPGTSCPNCGGKAIEHHEASGASICTDCGIVVEENAIVSSVEFVEGAGGSSSMVGRFVSATSSKAYSSAGGRGRYGFSRDSRETTLANGRRKIQDVASRLRLPGHYVDAAHRLYTIAVEKNFVRGRRSAHVIAACLYIACRQEKDCHMLIDFSDALAVNVYTLGTCFLKFRRLLGLKLEIVDPALYIYRFAAHLDLNEQANAVSLTALRLVARMRRDWIVAGRRPAGICAAALLIASRAHGFSRHHQDVTRILRVCGMTVKTRVKEFEKTDTAKLTLEQFHSTELQREADPPIFTKNKMQEARARAIRDGNVSLLTSGALDEPGKKGGRWRKEKLLGVNQQKFRELYQSLEAELVDGNGTHSSQTEQTSAETAADADANAMNSKDNQDLEQDTEQDKEKESDTQGELEPQKEKDTAVEKDAASKTASMPGSSTELVVRKEQQDTVDGIPTVWKKAYPRRSNGQALVLPDHSTAEERQPSTTPVEAKLSLGEWKEKLPSSIDTEIDEMFRSDSEQRQMEVIFNRINKDYIVQQERKENERRTVEAANADQENQDAAQAAGHARYSKNGRNRKQKDQTTEEQLMAAMSSRKVSRKINYDALSSIFDDTGSFSTDVGEGFGGEEAGMYEML